MGFFNSIKKSMGLAKGELTVQVNPEQLFAGGEINAQVTFNALKDLNINVVRMELVHTFPDEDYDYDTYSETMHTVDLATRISMKAGETVQWPAYITIPPDIAPAVGKFKWLLRTVVDIPSAIDVTDKQNLAIRLSPMMHTLFELITQSFGFVYTDIGAEEDCVWMTFKPTGAVRSHFGELELSFDEQDDTLTLWIALDGMNEDIAREHGDRINYDEGSIEITLNKREYVSGTNVNRDALMGRIQPLFTI